MEFPVNNNNHLRDKKSSYAQIRSQSCWKVCIQLWLLPAANDPCPWNGIRSGKAVNILAFLSPLRSSLKCTIHPHSSSTELKGKRKSVFHKESNAIHAHWPDSGMAVRRVWAVRGRPCPQHPQIPPPSPDYCLEFHLSALSLQLRDSQQRGGTQRAYQKLPGAF